MTATTASGIGVLEPALEMQDQLLFEKLLSKVSASFINVPLELVDQEIHKAMREVLEYFKVDRIALLETSSDNQSWLITHYISGPGIASLPAGRKIPKSVFPWFYEKVTVKGEIICISNINDIPRKAEADRRGMTEWGIRSLLLLPVVVGKSIDHAISISGTRRECEFPDYLIPRLKLLGEVFVNALERRKDRAGLEEQLRFQELMSDISAHFINITADQVDSEIMDAQRLICEHLGLELSALWQWSTEIPRIVKMTHIYRPLGGPPLPEPMYAHEYFPWCQNEVEAGRTINISSLDEVPPEASRDKETWLYVGSKSILTIPLVPGGGSIIGALSFNSMSRERAWPEPLVKQLRLIAQIFTNALIRKQMDREVRKREERLSITLDAVGAALWIMDISSKRVWVTQKSRELFHFAPDEEIYYENYFRLIHPEDRNHVDQVVKQAIESKTDFRCDYRIITPEGKARWISSRGRWADKTPDEPESLIGLSLDITERKELELSLKDNEERLRLVMEANSEGVWDWNIPSGNAYFSPRYSGMLGYEPDEFAKDYDSWKELVHPDDFDVVHKAHGEHINEGKEFCVEFRMRKKSGDWCWILSRAMVIERDASGNAIRMVGTHMDITRRKEMELEIKKSQTLIDSVINSSPDLIWSVDPERFGLMTFNTGLYDYFLNNVGLQITSGMNPQDLFPSSEEFQNIWSSFYRKVLKEGPFTTEYGPTYRGNLTLKLNFNVLKQGDNVFGISVFAQDVTGIKNMELRLREQLEEIKELQCRLEKENIYLRQEIKAEMGFGKIIGSSEAMEYVLFRSRQVAPTDATVIILGETGVGKGMIANAIHEHSSRKDRVMVTVTCAALPANLIESELFGREKGAFTGAHAKQAGRFEVADRGTIFLDEIGELPLELQAKLLRVLQDGEFERLGSPRSMKVDVRVIASTSRDLKQEVRNGRFREDLFYRLNTFPVTIPPLRKRVEDIPELARFFIDKYARKFGRKFDTMKKDTMKRLQGYDWPGNVRELEHVIERSVITSTEPVFDVIDKLENELAPGVEESGQGFETMAKDHIIRVLQKTGWKIDGQGGAAAILGLKPSTLRFRIKKLGIKRP